MSVYLGVFGCWRPFLSHAAGIRLTSFLIPEAVLFGSELVAAFFVLSGFVIGYVKDAREILPRLCATSRLAPRKDSCETARPHSMMRRLHRATCRP
jgi:hypothetical protein